MDGGSLVGLLTRGHDPDHRQVAVTEYGRSYDAGIVAVAVNTPEIKMIEHYAPEHGPELHGFGRSPERRFYRVTGMDERRLDGVDDEPAAVDIRRQLEELLGRSNALQPRADHTVELTADEVERLEALGYLE
jgi:hypothetical protein